MGKKPKEQSNFDPTLAPYETEKLLRDFAGVTGQQLLQILSAALGELDFATSTKDQKTRYEAVQTARRAAEQALGLARNLRFFTSQPILGIQTVELSQILLDTVDMVEKEFQSQGIKLNVFAEASTLIVADATALRQTILNLLYNAKESLSGGGTITLTLKKQNDGISVRISDSGQPVAGRDLSEVFQPHFNPQEAENRRVLSLAVAKVLVEAMGGDIEAEAPKGGGNVVSFYIPHQHKPTEPGFEQRRRFRRIKIDLGAEITLDKKPIPARMKVLGKGGCFLELGQDIAINPKILERDVTVTIFYFEDEFITLPHCRIVDSYRFEGHRGVGIRFDNLDAKADKIVRALVQGHTE